MKTSQTQPETIGFKDIPKLGVGLGLRHPLLEETLAAPPGLIDWLEITPENYMGKGGRAAHILERAQGQFPLIPHGVSMSVGSVDPWDEEYLKQFRVLFNKVQPHWFSDHLCFSGVQGTYFNDLLPLPRTQEAVAHVVKRIRFLQAQFDKPFLIENISFYVDYPQNELPEYAFLSEIVEQADCGLLLDVNNIYVNAQNQGFDPIEFLSQIPLERVVQIHVAGHTHYPEGIVDTHGDTVCQGVWELLDWVLKRANPSGVLLERDLNLPEFPEIEAELKQIRHIWDQAKGALESHQEGVLCH